MPHSCSTTRLTASSSGVQSKPLVPPYQAVRRGSRTILSYIFRVRCCHGVVSRKKVKYPSASFFVKNCSQRRKSVPGSAKSVNRFLPWSNSAVSLNRFMLTKLANYSLVPNLLANVDISQLDVQRCAAQHRHVRAAVGLPRKRPALFWIGWRTDEGWGAGFRAHRSSTQRHYFPSSIFSLVRWRFFRVAYVNSSPTPRMMATNKKNISASMIISYPQKKTCHWTAFFPGAGMLFSVLLITKAFIYGRKYSRRKKFSSRKRFDLSGAALVIAVHPCGDPEPAGGTLDTRGGR